MSIRLWLMMADCWMCGASIELTEEQERVARKLLEAEEDPCDTGTDDSWARGAAASAG